MRGGDECYQIQPKIIRRERSGLQMHCGDGRRFVVRADEKLTAFVELVKGDYEFALDAIS